MKKSVFALLVLCFNVALATMPVAPCENLCGKSTGLSCVTVGGDRLSYSIQGSGVPTVIFSSGTGMPAIAWTDSGIVPLVSKHYRTFTYDRLHTFNSCPNENTYMPNTAQHVVSRLHQLLAQEKIDPPFILVGHSFGGLYMLLYAEMYPNQVAGVLLLDATSKEGPTAFPVDSLSLLKRMGNPQNPSPENPLFNEMIGQLPSYLQAQAAPNFQRDIPLIVIGATKHCLPADWSEEPMCMSNQQEANHLRQQVEMSHLSDNSKFMSINGGHNVFFEKGYAANIADAIDQLVSIYQDSTQ